MPIYVNEITYTTYLEIREKLVISYSLPYLSLALLLSSVF